MKEMTIVANDALKVNAPSYRIGYEGAARLHVADSIRMPHLQPHARRAAVVGIASVLVKKHHVVVSLNRARSDVVLERNLSGHDLQVNAPFMSSCVSNARRAIVRCDDESTRRNVTRS